MPLNILEIQSMSGGVLLENLIQAGTEKGLLTASDAPEAELRNVQQKIDILQEEVLRRISW